MGARGPTPKPKAMRSIEGGAGKGGRDRSHRPAKTEPKFAPLTEHPPEWMHKEAKAEWRRLSAEFKRYPGLVQKPDREAMIALCSEWSEYLTAIKERTTTTGKAQEKARRHARDTLKNLHVMWARFGLTPGDRARFNMEKQGGDDDPILHLLTGSGEPSS